MTMTKERLAAEMRADPDVLAAVLEALNPKHAGGRKPGSKNNGPDKLEEAIAALNDRRAAMTVDEHFRAAVAFAGWAGKHDRLKPEQVRQRLRDFLDSEYRVNRLLSRPWPWNSHSVRKHWAAEGIPEEELAVVLAYKRSEYRDGMSKTARIVGALPVIGAGQDDPFVEDEETKKEAAGRVKRAKRHRPKRRSGYTTVHEEIVEGPLVEEEVLLWGEDVTAAIHEELGFEPVRSRSSKRSWLAPINATAEYDIGRRTVVGAGPGTNGRVRPTFGKDGLSYAADPTIAECNQAELNRDPVYEGLPYEPDGRVDRYKATPTPLAVPLDVTLPIGKLHEGSYTIRPDLPDRLPRSEGELLTGPHDTRWRETAWRETARRIVLRVLQGKTNLDQAAKAIRKAKRWRQPEGIVPQPAEEYISPVVAPLYPILDEQLARVASKMPVERIDRVCPKSILPAE